MKKPMKPCINTSRNGKRKRYERSVGGVRPTEVMKTQKYDVLVVGSGPAGIAAALAAAEKEKGRRRP